VIVGIGVDVIDIERVARMVAKQGDRLLQRLLTEGEVAFVAERAQSAQHVAVRLAAKEASYKALSGNQLARHIGWQDTEVVSRLDDGAPELRLHGRALERFTELGATHIHVSLSHSAQSAVAFVVVER
jgi:holo-[acyl-carrier protein] synthase